MEKLIKHPFFFYIKKFKTEFSLGCLALLITDAADILSPYIMGKLLDKFQEQQSLEGTKLLFIALIAASLSTAIFRYAWRVLFAKFHHGAALDLRLKTYRAFFKKDLIDFSKQSTGDKMSLFTKDIENFRMGLGPGLLILMDAVLYLIFIPLTMWQLNPQWTIALVLIAPIIPVIIALMEKRLNHLFDNQQKELSTLSAFTQESLEGIKVIKSFRMEKFRSHLYDLENKKLFKTSTKLDFLHSSFSPVLEFFVSVSCSALLLSVALYSDLGTLKIGTLFAFYQYMQRMTWPLTALGLSYMMITEAKSSFKRLKLVLEESPQEEQTETSSTGLSNVNFSYPESPAFFQNLDLPLKSGQSYLITGRTKSGKTTLLNLLSGLLIPSKGKSTPPESFVGNPQVPFLFMDSIDNNISNTPPSKEELKGISFLPEYENLADKGDTLVGEKGTSLSGGQKQRLSLLRALKSDAKILFLDEPLSAVDETTKKEISQTLKDEVRNGRSLVIATSNPEHYTWLENSILVSEEQDTRYVEVFKTAEALNLPKFKSLLRVKKEGLNEDRN
ncbi:MAG: ABC transporter ATP-binding protein [Bdellovibrionales bacterium]